MSDLPLNNGDTTSYFGTVPTQSLTKPYCFLPNNIFPIDCAVCGGRATGHHYQVAACNGCKTFFRRTVIEGRMYNCRSEGCCYKIGRSQLAKHCRACRMEKCVQSGMNPLAIQMTEEHRNSLTVQYILRKQNERECNKQKTLTINLNSLTRSVCDIESSVIISLECLECSIESFRCRNISVNFWDFDLPFILQQTSMLSSAEKYERIVESPVNSLADLNMCQLGDENGSAFSLFFTYYRKHWPFYDLLTAVEYAKTFSFFKLISAQDMITFARHIAVPISTFMAAYYSYSRQSDTFIYPDGTLPPECILTRIFSAGQLIIKMKLRKEEYLMVKAILLCNAAGHDITEFARRLIREEQSKMAKTLFQYCMKRNGVRGPARFVENLTLIGLIEQSSIEIRGVHIAGQIRRKNIRSLPLVEAAYSI